MTGSGFRLDADAHRSGCFWLVLHQGSGRRQGEVQPVNPAKRWRPTRINDQLASHRPGCSNPHTTKHRQDALDIQPMLLGPKGGRPYLYTLKHIYF